MFEVITRPTEWLHSMSGFVVLKSQKFRDNTYTCNQQKLIDLKRINEQNQWTWNEFHVKNRFQNNPMIVETTNSHHPWKSLIVIWNHWASVNIISKQKEWNVTKIVITIIQGHLIWNIWLTTCIFVYISGQKPHLKMIESLELNNCNNLTMMLNLTIEMIR